jgi:hypothetical protein
VIYKNQEALKKLHESFHRSPLTVPLYGGLSLSDGLAGYQKSSVGGAGGINQVPMAFRSLRPGALARKLNA